METQAIIVEAKNTYTKKLIQVLCDPFKNYYNNLKTINPNLHEELRKIPEWNSTILGNFVNDVKKNCSWLDQLISAIFISHTKILSSVKLNDKKQTIKLKIPETDHFIHKIFENCSECVYYNIELLPIDKDKMMSMLTECMDHTISEMLPFENLLDMYIREEDEEDEEDEGNQEIKNDIKDDDDYEDMSGSGSNEDSDNLFDDDNRTSGNDNIENLMNDDNIKDPDESEDVSSPDIEEDEPSKKIDLSEPNKKPSSNEEESFF